MADLPLGEVSVEVRAGLTKLAGDFKAAETVSDNWQKKQGTKAKAAADKIVGAQGSAAKSAKAVAKAFLDEETAINRAAAAESKAAIEAARLAAANSRAAREALALAEAEKKAAQGHQARGKAARDAGKAEVDAIEQARAAEAQRAAQARAATITPQRQPKSARASASVFAAGFRAEADAAKKSAMDIAAAQKAAAQSAKEYAATLERLRGDYDRLGSAQATFRRDIGDIVRLQRSGALSSAEAARMTKAAGAAYRQAANEARAYGQSLRSTQGALGTIKGALIGLGLGAIAKDISETAIKFRGFDQSLKIITGSTAGAREEMSFIEGIAAKLGFRVRDLAEGYIALTAATRGTSLEGKATRELFTQLNTAAAAYGLSNDRLKLALLAVQQIASKGVVTMEDLRGQLGEQLPGAMQVAARAMHMTQADFNAFVGTGQLMSDEFLPKFAAQLKKEIPEGTRSAAAGFNAFLTELDKAKVKLAEGGFFEGLTTGAAALGAELQKMSDSGALAEVGAALGNLIKLAAQLVPWLPEIAAGFVGMKVASIAAVAIDLLSGAFVAYRIAALAGAGATAAFTAALASNPVGWIIAAVGLAAAGLTYYAIKTDDATKATSALGEVTGSTAEGQKALAAVMAQDKSGSLINGTMGLANARSALTRETLKAAWAEAQLQAAAARNSIAMASRGVKMVNNGRGGTQEVALDTTRTRAGSEQSRALAVAIKQGEDAVAAVKAVGTGFRNLKAAADAASSAVGATGGASGGANARAISKRERMIADLEKLKLTATGKDLDKINSQIALRQKQIGFLKQGVSEQAAVAAAAGSGGKGTSAATLAKRAEAARVKGIREDEAFNKELSGLNDDLLQAKQDQTNDAKLAAELERHRIDNEAAANQNQINADLDAKKYSKAQADELTAKNEAVRLERQRTVDIEEQRRVAKEAADLKTEQLDNDIEYLRAQDKIVSTASEHRAIALQILSTERTKQKLALEQITIENGYKPIDVAIAKAKMALLDATVQLAEQAEKLATEGPLEQYLRTRRPTNSAQVNEAGQNVRVDQFRDLDQRAKQFSDDMADSFGRAAQGILDMKNPLDVMRDLLGDLAHQFQQEFLVRPLTDMIKQSVTRPLAERLVTSKIGGKTEHGVAGDYGLNAAQMNTALRTSTTELMNFTVALRQASVAAGTSGGGNLLGGISLPPYPTGGTGAGPLFDGDQQFTGAYSAPLIDSDKLTAVDLGLGNVGATSDKLTAALSAQIPVLGQFGGALGQAMSMLAGGGGGGGGGIFGSLLKIGMSAFGGGGLNALGGTLGGAGAFSGLSSAITGAGPIGNAFAMPTLAFADGGSPGDRGGLIRGPGSGRSDSIMAMSPKGPIRVSNGEFLINEEATRKHRPLIEMINADRLPGFADGGAVGGLMSRRMGSIVRPIQFGDTIVQGGGGMDDRSARRTGKQIAAEHQRQISVATRSGITR